MAGGDEAVAALAPQRAGQVWARALPFGVYMLFLAIGPLIAAVFPALDVRWLYPIKAGAVAMTLALCWRHCHELGPLRLSPAGWAAALVCGVAVFLLWTGPDPRYLTLGFGGAGSGFDPRLAGGGIDWPLAAVRLAGAALVVPVMEELFWRSLIMRWLDRSDFLAVKPGAVSLRALALSSVLFGIEHHLWLAGIAAGFVYGELYRRYGKLWVPVAAHAATNGLLGAWVLWSGQWQYW